MRRIAGQAPATLAELVQQGLIEYIPFPDALRGKYQCFTQADQTHLKQAGYTGTFLNVEQGVSRYIDWLNANADFLSQPST